MEAPPRQRQIVSIQTQRTGCEEEEDDVMTAFIAKSKIKNEQANPHLSKRKSVVCKYAFTRIHASVLISQR